MSLHFPTLSWRDALSLIGVRGERIRQKKAEEQKCLSNFSIIPQTANVLDMIIMFVHFLATCYTNKTVKSWLAWRLHETDTVLSCLCCWKFIPIIESAVSEHIWRLKKIYIPTWCLFLLFYSLKKKLVAPSSSFTIVIKQTATTAACRYEDTLLLTFKRSQRIHYPFICLSIVGMLHGL